MPRKTTRLTTTPMAIWSPELRVMAVSDSPEAPAVSGFCGAGFSLGDPPGSLTSGAGEDVMAAETVTLEERALDAVVWATLGVMTRRSRIKVLKRNARSFDIAG